MAITTGWDTHPYNERHPFGSKATVVGGDNIYFSRVRHEAIRAMKEGRATPEQAALVNEADVIMQEAVAKRST